MISTADPGFARRMLERAIAHQTKPTLDTAAVDDLMAIAVTSGTGGDPDVYTGVGLNRAASIGWQWKSAIVSDQYDLGGGAGKTLDRSQWYSHCMRMAADFAAGAKGVLDGGAAGNVRRSGIGSIGMVSSTAVAGGELP